MLERYAHLKGNKAQGKSTGAIGIRMTNAQIHADAAVKAKNTLQEVRADFKLKRFQNVEPRTSTKRGDQAFMVKSRKIASSPFSGAAMVDENDRTTPA